MLFLNNKVSLVLLIEVRNEKIRGSRIARSISLCPKPVKTRLFIQLARQGDPKEAHPTKHIWVAPKTVHIHYV